MQGVFCDKEGYAKMRQRALEAGLAGCARGCHAKYS